MTAFIRESRLVNVERFSLLNAAIVLLLFTYVSFLIKIQHTTHASNIGRVQVGKAASLLAKQIEHNWFLLINPINHIKLLSERAMKLVASSAAIDIMCEIPWLTLLIS